MDVIYVTAESRVADFEFVWAYVWKGKCGYALFMTTLSSSCIALFILKVFSFRWKIVFLFMVLFGTKKYVYANIVCRSAYGNDYGLSHSMTFVWIKRPMQMQPRTQFCVCIWLRSSCTVLQAVVYVIHGGEHGRCIKMLVWLGWPVEIEVDPSWVWVNK